jgi:hypothetical protein
VTDIGLPGTPAAHAPAATPGSGTQPTFMRRRGRIARAHHEDPMATMGNLFDVAILMGVGLLIMALSSFGLRDLLSKDNLTIVKNPGQPNMEIITRQAGRITRLTKTGQQAQGAGVPVGTVYKLESGQMIWVPNAPGAPAPTPAP